MNHNKNLKEYRTIIGVANEIIATNDFVARTKLAVSQCGVVKVDARVDAAKWKK